MSTANPAVPGLTAASPDTTSGRLEICDIWAALLVGLVAFLIFNANMRAISAADTYAARYLPFTILRHHDLLLDSIVNTVAQGRIPVAAGSDEGTAYWIVQTRDGPYVSRYPLVLPIVIAPLYYPAIAYLDRYGWDPHRFDLVARTMEKLIASLIAATSGGLLYLVLRRRSSPGLAAFLSLMYALGTTTWTISSQALWQHGLGQLLIVATMLLITGPRTAVRVALAGFLCATIAANRQPDTILAAALGLYGLWWAGRSIPLFFAAGVPPIALTVAYNLMAVGHIAGAYALNVPKRFNADVIGGIAGLLFSPTRGLFVFSPFLLFVPCMFGLALTDRKTRALTLALAASMAVQVVVYAFVDWRQGISWGPRWLTDLVPLLIWMLPPIVAALSRPGRAIFAVACGLALVIQSIGAFWYTGASDTILMTTPSANRTRPMWQPGNAAFIAELNHPRAPADLLRMVRGNLDLVAFVDVVVKGDDQGDRIERHIDMAGWALANTRSPTDVAVIIDGRDVAGTSSFFTRPDVVQSLGVTSPAGWRITFSADKFAPGEHQATILVRADPGGEPRLLLTRSLTIPADNTFDRYERLLAHSARLAVQRLSEHLQPLGYWLTSYTNEPGFTQPRQEMNTYLNGIILDIAGPAADAIGMRDMLVRARTFLTSQIEADGLVRYHGRPDAPTIGALGCAITPDSDDTALAWRIAPGQSMEQRANALETMRQYRRADGLYQTWLSERTRYTCIDPGKDPNPADIGIQMHVFMLLAQEDPQAARALCQALERHADDADIWVYYAAAPPVVILRLADLRKADCPLALPASRLQTNVPGQDIWIMMAQALRQMDGTTPTLELFTHTAKLLRQVAANEFSLLAHTPPLLYHNDLSAKVRRFYWSEDLGYALWLRLYEENKRMGSQLGCTGGDTAHGCGHSIAR